MTLTISVQTFFGKLTYSQKLVPFNISARETSGCLAATAMTAYPRTHNKFGDMSFSAAAPRL